MRSRGFTLIELLVVIVIIAVLASLVMSGIQSAKEQGQAAQCISNLRQLAQANLAYATDNNGMYVPAQEASNRIRWHGERTYAKDPFDPSAGPLAPYLGREGRVKLCPTFRDALKGAKSFEEGTGGYGYNAAYIGGTAGRPFQPERMVNVPRPARTVMFTDTAFPRGDGLQEYAYSEPFQWVDLLGRPVGALAPSVHFRHREKANVAWCDGHVTSEPWSVLGGKNRYGGDAEKATIGWFGPREDNGYWKP